VRLHLSTCATLALLVPVSLAVAQDVPPAPDNASTSPNSAAALPDQLQEAVDPVAIPGIQTLTASSRIPAGLLPENRARKPLIQAAAMEAEVDCPQRGLILVEKQWRAPAMRHLPLLFEEPNLERNGWERGCRPTVMANCHPAAHQSLVQPFVSAGHFFGRIPLVILTVADSEPCVPIYTFGDDVPNSPECYRRYGLFQIKDRDWWHD
jgi:hypothetical protein